MPTEITADRDGPATETPPRPIEVLGSTTCEDTALVRSRLQMLGVPFRDVDIDADPGAAQRMRDLNGGHRITPTVVIGDGRSATAEPTLERLGELIADAGYEARPPVAAQLHGELTTRPIPQALPPARPLVHLSMASGQRRQTALFLGHGAACLPCLGYARQLAARHEELADADAIAVSVVPGDDEAAREWRAALDARATVAADPGGAWKAALAAHVDVPARDAIVLILDRFGAPRVTSHAAEAGGLVDPSEAVEWLGFLDLECPECSGEIEWPDDG
ncbi:MAG TPA: glutaredoxin family protein [Candidatus Limnocylindrales bacterium]|nr:glutaredoxin family protein [Candidatus Limnocylindrales bacterium]